MGEFDPRLYGARWAEEYDDWHAGLMDDEGAVRTLAELAGADPVLEFGVGTGRLAVPLADQGCDVVGVDISEDMLAKLTAKSSKVATVVGYMTTVRVPREFGLAYVAFNSIFVLGTQAEQVELFRNAAAHLKPGGRFVLETQVISSSGGEERPKVSVMKVEHDKVTLAMGTNDPVTAFHEGMWLVLEPAGIKFYPIHGRHVTHHEMDLMAQLTGLELEDRWGDWQRTPFGKKSKMHVSVYRKPRTD